MFLFQEIDYFPIDEDIEINNELENDEDIYNKFDESRINLLQRKKREILYGFTKEDKVFIIHVGDFLEVFYFFRGHFLSFEGLCLSIRRKNLLHPDTSLFLRNNIQNVWVDCSVSFFYNRVYSLKILDYKRKLYSFKKSKWLFLKKVSDFSFKNQKKNTKVIFYLSRAYIKL